MITMIDHPRHRPISAAAIGFAVLLAGCTVGPDFVRPVPQVPPHWPATPASATPASATSAPATAVPAAGPENAAAAPGSTPTEQAEQRAWWSAFNDPHLTALIERAVTSNLDLQAAVLRMQESRAQRDVTASGEWPSVSLDTAYSRNRISETTPTGSLLNSVGTIKLPGAAGISIPNPYSQYQLSADASWEIDLFGRVRRSVESADAGVQASLEDQHAVHVSLMADVGQSYVALRGAQARLELAHENLATIDELLELTRERRAAGLTTHIDVSNALAQHDVTLADLPTFELQITQNVNQLSRLLGLEPEALRAELQTPAPIPAVPAAVPIGLPADMARRRPDIREAEANLHGATAQIGVAVGDLFPRLTLSGSGGYQSDSAGRLVEWASRFGSIGPSLDVPVFDRGRWKTVRLQKVRAQEAALAYRRIVLNALHEADNALAAYAADQQHHRLLEATVAQNTDVRELSRQRYAAGVAPFTDVLNAQRTLQQNQAFLLDSEMAVAADLVQLYRALGGGWQAEEGTVAAVPPR
jgi:NodT family efflux transporter outer membrane factor (OMF) lipoprotein